MVNYGRPARNKLLAEHLKTSYLSLGLPTFLASGLHPSGPEKVILKLMRMLKNYVFFRFTDLWKKVLFVSAKRKIYNIVD